MKILKPIFFVLMLSYAQLILAQSPGGVSTGNVGWFKADLGTTGNTNAAFVSTWADQAGTAQNFTASGGDRPRFYNTTTPVNLNPYVRFAGNDVMAQANSTDINNVTSDQRTLIMVFRTGSNVTNTQVLYEEGGAANANAQDKGLSMFVSNSQVYVSAWNVPNDGVGSPWTWKGVSTGIADNTNANVTNTYIVSMVMNGNTSITGTINGYLNGANFGAAANVGRLYAHTGAIGLGRANAQTRTAAGAGGVINNTGDLDGDIMEFAYYQATALSNSDRNKIESYLAVKYGITLNQTIPTDYVDSAGNIIYAASGSHSVYNNDIAGIGIDSSSGLSQSSSRSLNADDIVRMNGASSMASGEFMLWGNNNDDNGTIAEIATGIPGTTTTRLDRVWRVDETGDVGTVSVSFDLSSISVTGTTASNFGLLVDSGDSDFTSGSRMIAAASYTGGVVTFNNVDFSDGDYFTLATNIVQPSVTMSVSPTTIGETGGTTVSTVTATLSGPWHSTVTVNFSFTGSATGGGVDYTASASSVVIPATATISGSFTVTSVDDALAEGTESTLIEITSVTNGTESGTQQQILTITDDELVNNACTDTEQVFTTELTSGDVNIYSLFGTLEATSTSAYTGNYEMIIDPDNLYRYLAAYTGQKITRAEIDGTGEIVLWDTAGTNPFQIAIDPLRNKIYWTEWSTNARIMCANLDGTGVATAIATGEYYPTGMQIDVASGNLYVYNGFNSPPILRRTTTDGTCSAASFTTLLSSPTLPLAYNLTIDPPGSRLFFVDYNANNIVKINTDGTGLNLNLWSGGAPGDQLRDIVYNKNTDQLFYIYTNGVVQKALADGTGTVSTVVSLANAQPDSRSIDICVDSVAPRLVSFTSFSSNGTYCPGSTINITATYDETVEPGSSLTVVLSTGASVLLNNVSGTTISGTYTVGVTGSGQNTTDLTVSSISSELVSDSNGNDRTNSTVPISPNNIADLSAIIVDTAAPTLTEVTPVPNPTINRNPPYTFSSSETGSMTFAGGCSSVTTAVASGNNTITLDSNGSGGTLADGLYDNCSITVLDTPACNSAVLNISDFEVAGTIPSVTLSIDNANISETGGVATVTATLSNTYALPVTVNLSFSGTAGGGDYTTSSSSIVIPALSLSNTMTIAATGDLLAEGNETVIVDISSVTNGTESGVQQVTTTILDDDGVLVTLSVNNATISESGGSAIFTATLSGTSASDVTVNLGFSGTASHPADYTRTGTSILITSGNLTASVTVTAVDDPDYEEDETVIVDITSVTNAFEDGTQQATTTIQDDQVCSYDPMATPTGLTALLTMTIDGSEGPVMGYTPISGDDFGTDVMNRTAPQNQAWRDEAEQFFLDEYGIDFDGANMTPDMAIVLSHWELDSAFNTRLHAMSGRRISANGGEVRSGFYSMLVVSSAGATFYGNWGGAGGTWVPPGTVVEFGEYAINIPQPCKDYDGDMETDEIEETIYLAFRSARPNLADFASFNGSLFIDIPAVFEYDLTTGDGVNTYAYTSGKIYGRKELRELNTNDVVSFGNIIVTVP